MPYAAKRREQVVSAVRASTIVQMQRAARYRLHHQQARRAPQTSCRESPPSRADAKDAAKGRMPRDLHDAPCRQ